MQNNNLFIEILRIILTWPVVIFIIIIIFRKEAASLINRIQSFGIGDKIRIDCQGQEQKSRGEELKKKAEELEKELKTIKTQQEKDKFELNKHIFFEATYNIIFKSQIELLKSLKIIGTQGLRWNWIMISHYPRIMFNYPFPAFMNFLSTTGLLTWQLIDNNKDAIVTITKLGEEFLDYLNIKGYIGAEKVI